jgi:hypothetical protein
METTEWINIPEDILDYQAFVYLILTKDKYYIGYKNIYRIEKKKPLKGMKNKRCQRVETNWREYTGSNDKLNEYISKGGLYTKYILYTAKTKAEAQYVEAQMQFDLDVLMDDKSYNGQIRYRGSGLGLKDYNKQKYRKGLDDALEKIR